MENPEPKMWKKIREEPEFAEYCFNKGKEHAEPSRDTLKIFKEVEMSLTELKNDSKYIKERLARMEKKIDKTNGSVKKLQLWKAGVVGAVSILTIGSSFIVVDYFDKRDTINETAQAVKNLQENGITIYKE